MSSSLNRVSTGIHGLDRLTRGGFPQEHTVTLLGTYGTGKTITAIHFLHEGIANNENCLYISTDEQPTDIASDATYVGLNLNSTDHGTFASLSYESTDLVDQTLQIIENTSADRIVIDSLSVILSHNTTKNPRDCIQEIQATIKQETATGLITAEQHHAKATRSRNTVAEHVTDGVIHLDYTAVTEKTFRTIEVRKLRKTPYRPGAHPMTINTDGIQIDTDTTL